MNRDNLPIVPIEILLDPGQCKTVDHLLMKLSENEIQRRAGLYSRGYHDLVERSLKHYLKSGFYR